MTTAALRQAPSTTYLSPDFARRWLPWIACVALLVVTGLFISYIGAGLEDDPRKDLFGPIAVPIVAIAGGLGVWLASRTGFPEGWDARVSNKVRFVYPAAIGLALGVVSIVLELLSGGIAFFLEDTGYERFNAPLPGSVLLYGAGAVVLEVFYRLLPIPLLLWGASKLGVPERHQTKLFWVIAVSLSLLEPFGQTQVALQADRIDLAITQGGLGFMYNLLQAYWFRRAGFLSALSLRWGHYAVWHLLYGGLISPG